ncbi:MAG TPA: class E sortase [Mycobacteriales bacterium]|nr:class E sortase [Mycobacteriales bacterium]
MIRTLIRGLGQTLMTFGVVVLLFCVYELKVTNIYTGREQARLDDALQETWQAAPPSAAPTVRTIPLGSGFAVLRIPRLGRDWGKVVVEGVTPADLKRGPGHYPGTALPGEIGNSVVSGHRTTYGAPFSDLDRLRPADAVVVETRDSWFTYRVTRSSIVAPTAVEVIYAVPGQRDAKPTKRLLTLTTCNPKYSAAQRLIVHAELEGRLAKQPGVVPPALQEA